MNKLNLPPGVVMLDMDSPTFAEDLAKELGDGPFETVTPQFHRTDKLVVAAPSLTSDEWANMDKLSLERIRQIGCQIWEEDEKGIHWLFPSEWYPYIPDGLEVLTISGHCEAFMRGVTDDDIRFGALPYGFRTLKGSVS